MIGPSGLSGLGLGLGLYLDIADCSDWMRVRGAVDFSPGGVMIGYIRRARCERFLTDSTPVTGSLVFSALLDYLDVCCAAEFAPCQLLCGTDCAWLAGFGLSFRRLSLYRTMATEGAALVENRSMGRTEAVVDIHSEGVVPLGSIPVVVGVTGRRPDAAECRILQGRDVCSVRVLVPGSRGLDQNFHDVTIVDMGDVPESPVSIPELSLLRQQWPPAFLSHMVWLQQDHCPGAQCGRARHMIVWIMFGWHMMFLGTLSRPVRRQVSLKPCHSGISTDILLFSDINLSLVHHYRIH